MRILEYKGLRTNSVATAYEQVLLHLKKGQLQALDIRKLSGGRTSNALYRIKLGYADRLIFCFVEFEQARAVLMLEVVRGHDYSASKFLRGAIIEPEHIEVVANLAEPEIVPLRYLHPRSQVVHWLDRPLSFDDAQTKVLNANPPVILVGSAGSGKTALNLEKLKQYSGDVLYLTQSAFLARNAQEKYFSLGEPASQQNPEFFSFNAFLETFRILVETPINWQYFVAWFQRVRPSLTSAQAKSIDAHQLFEEIRGVLCAPVGGRLSKADYLALGIRQSIYSGEQKNLVYALFERFVAQLKQDRMYEPSLAAFERLDLAKARYDFIVIDEVQDLTPVQIHLALSTLRTAGQFLLCGDSNQIVHPNFFSWAQLKSLFWQDPAGVHPEVPIEILTHNFRNARASTELANQLLKIKHRRFGSIDRESNFLIQCKSEVQASAKLLDVSTAQLQQLNQSTRRSTKFAVLVLREEDKAAAKKVFETPLVFCIQEAKGLEYEHIVLYRFVSDQRANYAEICDGVTLADLQRDDLAYARAKDKGDKSQEIYRFFINALYVGVTRALCNVYLLEQDLNHPLFALLQLKHSGAVIVASQTSTSDEWEQEAKRLEQQGKLEQAQAIASQILRHKATPWTPVDTALVTQLLNKTVRDNVPGDKPRRQLLDYLAFHTFRDAYLALSAQFYGDRGADLNQFDQHRLQIWRRLLEPYRAKNPMDVMLACQNFGVNHRDPMNATPLMMAAAAGNVGLVKTLVARGASITAFDSYGATALSYALRSRIGSPAFASQLDEMLDELAPASIDTATGAGLRRMGQHQIEYWIMQCLIASNPMLRCTHEESNDENYVNTAFLLRALEVLPTRILPQRARIADRSYINGVLSRNALGTSYGYSKRLFERIRQGVYSINAQLSLRYGEEPWQGIAERLNYPLLFETTRVWREIARVCSANGIALKPAPTIFTRLYQAAEKQRLQQMREFEELAQQRAKAEQAFKAASEAKKKPSLAKPTVPPAKPTPVAAEPVKSELSQLLDHPLLLRYGLEESPTDPAWGTKQAKMLVELRYRAKRLR